MNGLPWRRIGWYHAVMQQYFKAAASPCLALMLGATACAKDETAAEQIESADQSAQPEETPQQVISAALRKLEERGDVPKLDRSEGLTGRDENEDGIRDDIELYIESLDLPGPRRAAARQEARAYQVKLATDSSDAVAVRAASVLQARAINCLSQRWGNGREWHQVSRSLEKFTFNTEKRVAQRMAMDRARSGHSLRLPSGNTCEP